MSYKALYSGDGSALQADIWFVHGLRGDSIETWTKDGLCWPKELLKRDVKNCRIFTWSYDSKVANITSSASNATIFGHAESFLQDIAMSRESAEEEERPIVFVGHSLGGLVIKEALIRSSEYLHNQQDSELGAIYATTKGVLFLGTPHRGSEATPYGHIVAKIAKLAWRQPNTHLITLLETESPILEKQRKSFASISKDLSVACLYEEVPTAIGMIVPEWSAVIDGFNVKQRPIAGDHTGMCKFSSRDDAGYRSVLYMIRTILKKEFRVKQQRIAVMTQALLVSLDFPAMDSREDGVDNAHDSTFEWFVRDITYPERPSPSPLKDWLSSTESIYWISGKAGCGKSTLMKYAITNYELPKILETIFPEKTRIVASHYLFERGKDPLQKSREGLLRHLLYHLITQDKSLALPAFRYLGAVRSFDSDRHWNWKDLKGALLAVLSAISPNTAVFCFIDGLDEYREVSKMDSVDFDDDDDEDEDMSTALAEAITDGHREIAELVRNLAGYANVRICVSSRPLLVFKDSFEKCRTIELHTKTAGDIAKYVTDQLAKNNLLSRLSVIEPTFEEDVKKEILERAEGVFLWVKLVMGVIIRGLQERDTAEELLFKLRLMPKQLGGKNGLYMTMLRNLSLENRNEGYRYFRILQKAEVDLDPLLVSFATDHEDQVYSMSTYSLTADETDARRIRTAERLLTRCGGLLEIKSAYDGVMVNFIHQTAKEFVRKRSNWDILLGKGSGGPFDGSLALQRAGVMALKRSKPRHEGWKNGADVAIWECLLFCLSCARTIDPLSRESSAKLILLADRVMFNLYRPRYLCDFSLTDFPTSRFKDNTPSLQRLMSHLTPQNGVSGIISPLHAHHWSVMDPFASGVPKSKNLMAVAVQNSLFSFLDVMASQPFDLSLQCSADYPLLAHGLVPFRVENTLKDNSRSIGKGYCTPEVTALLMRAGANPNQRYLGPAYYEDCTVWQGFLVHGDLLFDPSKDKFNDYGKGDGTETFSIWLENAKLLILYGADLNMTCPVVDQKTLVDTYQRHYIQRSVIYIMITILWRAARNQGWRRDLLHMMVAKGACLRDNEKEALLELAERIRVPQPLIRSVSEIVLERCFDDTVIESQLSDVHLFPQPLMQTYGNGGNLSPEDDENSKADVSYPMKRSRKTKWRQKQSGLKKFLKELVSKQR